MSITDINVHDKASPATTYTVPVAVSTVSAVYTTDGSMCIAALPFDDASVLHLHSKHPARDSIELGTPASATSSTYTIEKSLVFLLLLNTALNEQQLQQQQQQQSAAVVPFTQGISIFAVIWIDPDQSTNVVQFGKCPVSSTVQTAAARLRTTRGMVRFDFACGADDEDLDKEDEEGSTFKLGVKVPDMHVKKATAASAQPASAPASPPAPALPPAPAPHSSGRIVVSVVLDPRLGTAQFYMNSQLVDSRELSAKQALAVSSATMSPTSIGPLVGDTEGDFDLADVAVYNRALSPAERNEVDEYLFNSHFSMQQATPLLPLDASNKTTAGATATALAAPAATTACLSVDAGESGLLKCPNANGIMTSIQFASAGHPAGACSSIPANSTAVPFVVDPEYHIATSFATSGMNCIGKAECTLSATESMFPLGSLPKRTTISTFLALGDGCCRVSDGGAGTFLVHQMDPEACMQACTALSSCVGYELSMGGTCELHTAKLTHVATVQGCSCFVKKESTTQARPPMRLAVQAKCSNAKATATPFLGPAYASPSITALHSVLSSSLNDGISLRSCDEHGWYTPSDVHACGSSKLYNEDKAGKCYKGGMSHTDALMLCRAEGARLCTVAELAREVGKNTGCKLGRAVVWTGDQCFGGFMVALGSSKEGKQSSVKPACKRGSKKRFSVRCCADTRAAIHLHAVATQKESGLLQTKACSALPNHWKMANPGKDTEPSSDGSDNAPATCGASKVLTTKHGKASCPTNNGALNYATAAAICINAGGRLCSVHELVARNAGHKTGCGIGKDLIWTRDSCILDEAEGGLVGNGNSGMMVAGRSSRSKEPICAAISQRSFSVSCCASSVPVDIDV